MRFPGRLRYADAAATQQIGRTTLDYDAKARLTDLTHRDALDAIVAACFAKFTAAEMVDKLDAAHIANAQLNSVADLSEHPFLRNSVAQIGAYEVSLAALPVTSQVGAEQRVPNLGAQSDALRAEFKA